VIPARAQAKLSARLVPNQEPKEIAQLITDHLKRNTPEGIRISVTVHPGMGSPVRTSSDCRIVKAAQQAFADVVGTPCTQSLEGASIPISTDLAAASESEVVLIGYALPTDCIHAPNEHFGLDRFRKGFATIGRLLELLAE
jgi:acetylornithine deacetylase/succinyl-diaminopimelate desuccinylase-like protein